VCGEGRGRLIAMAGPSGRAASLAETVARQVETEVQENLDLETGLRSLSRRSGYSPFHFHRVFTKTTGEPPKRYVERLRLERAAYLLAVTEERVLAVALTVGFSNHETFSRGFRRRFSCSPSQYRARARKLQTERLARNASFTGKGCVLSKVWFGSLPRTRLLSIRHVGAYVDVSSPFSEGDRLWNAIAAWARAARVSHDPTPWVIAYDDPTVTPGPKQRLDACLEAAVALSTSPPVRLLEFGGGRYGGVEHIGPHETLDQAYRHVADGIRRSPRHAFGVGPPVEIMRHIDRDPRRHRTEVYFPVVSK
jgi:AraC family transcriptional regulator